MSLNDVLRIQKERKKRSEQIFNKIFDRVKIRINHSAKYGATNCYYDIPQLLYGLPSVNLRDCGDFIQKKLKKEGFVVYRLSETYFLISWEESAVEEQVQERKRKEEARKERKRLDDLEDSRREDLMDFLITTKER